MIQCRDSSYPYLTAYRLISSYWPTIVKVQPHWKSNWSMSGQVMMLYHCQAHEECCFSIEHQTYKSSNPVWAIWLSRSMIFSFSNYGLLVKSDEHSKSFEVLSLIICFQYPPRISYIFNINPIPPAFQSQRLFRNHLMVNLSQT